MTDSEFAHKSSQPLKPTAKPPRRVAVTGAAGQIGYSLIFRIATGEMLGSDQPVILQLLEIPPAMKALEGVAMEIQDCAFGLLQGIKLTDTPKEAFDGVDWALLVGSRPRSKGMERKDLIKANGAIFTTQGQALNNHAADNLRVLVVGNPANTNCLIAQASAPDIPKERFSAMMRLDHNRALAQLAAKCGADLTDITQMTIWGNHSATQYPDVYNCLIKGENAVEHIDDENWVFNEFIPQVQQRGAAIIEARGASSAASAANAAIDHVRDWAMGSQPDDWVSMAVPSDGSYGVPEGLIASFACTTNNSDYNIVEGLKINNRSRQLIDLSIQELQEERTAVVDLGLLDS